MKRCLNCMNEYPDEYGDLCPSCGYMDGATQNGGVALQPGTILQARYIVGTVIRERETDIIYIGWDALFDRRVQIQEYFPRYCATRSGKPELSIYDNKQEIYEKGLEFFYWQSRLLIRLYKEEDIITYHACFMENRTAYAVMDFSQDMTLKKRLESHRYSVNEAKEWLEAAMEAVIKVHQLGVDYQINLFHGQIEPESFWEKPDGRIVLKDFGASRYISGEPGIVDYGNAGPHTDVYGLAKMFCQLITGKEIEDGEKLESELARKQIGLKKPVLEALERALLHKTRTVEAFQRELWGRKRVSRGKKEKKHHGSLSLPRWVIPVAALVMAGLIAFTGLVAAGKIDLLPKTGESQLPEGKVRVPNIINKEVAEAQEILEEKSLQMTQDKMVFSKEIPENMISYQSEKENAIVDKDASLVVWISKGEEKAVIPSVIGLDRKEALSRLKEAGFTQIHEEESQDEGIYNSVLAISEEAGANVELSREIVLTICKNKSAQDGDSTVQVKVPDIVGEQKDQAESKLKTNEFQINWVEETSDEPEGTVIRQEPAADEEANKGSFVTAYVSIGAEKIYMPNIQLESQEDAERMIESLGLTVGKISQNNSNSVAAGKVISQSIACGTEVKKGDSVDLVISLGPKDPSPKKPAPTPTKPKATQAPPTAPSVILPPAQTPEPTPAPTPAPTQVPESTLAETSASNTESSSVLEESSKTENPSTSAPTTEAAQMVESTVSETSSVETPAPTPAPTQAPTMPPAPAPTSAPPDPNAPDVQKTAPDVVDIPF